MVTLAQILAGLTPDYATMTFWVWVVFGYYILSTLLPINKVIGRIYPVFGLALVFMAVSLIIALFAQGYHILFRGGKSCLIRVGLISDDFRFVGIGFVAVRFGQQIGQGSRPVELREVESNSS